MSLIKLIRFNAKADARGQLVALEGERNVPFNIQRVYYMTHLKTDLPRGFHAHKKLQQLAVCLAGECRIILDDGRLREAVWLNSAAEGLMIRPMIWHEMEQFSPDCVLMILADAYYDEADYIRDYEAFIKVSGNA